MIKPVSLSSRSVSSTWDSASSRSWNCGAPTSAQCSRIGPMFSPRLVPTMSSSYIHEAASSLQFIQLRITTKLPPQCVLIIVISRRPLNPLSPLLPDSGLQCCPYPLDYSTLPKSFRFAPGSCLTFQQGYLSVS